MDRLTKRDGDIVYMVKDGELLAPVALSGQEVRMVLQKLAEYEDEIAELHLDMNTQNACLGSYRHALYEAEKLIAEQVRHGKWNEAQIKLFEDAPTKGFECSLCKNGWFNVDGFIFCPKCGAKMDGEL